MPPISCSATIATAAPSRIGPAGRAASATSALPAIASNIGVPSATGVSAMPRPTASNVGGATQTRVSRAAARQPCRAAAAMS